LLIKKQGKLKYSFDKSWSVQIKAGKNNDFQIMKSQGKTGAGN
jgi:hypothetical protein